MLRRRINGALLIPVFASTIFAGNAVGAAQTNPASSTRVVQMVNIVANLEKTIDPKKSHAGDVVNAKTTSEATLSDGTKVPEGSVLVGHIDSITPSENKGSSSLVLTFNKLDVKNGKEVWVKTVIVRVASYTSSYGPELASGNSEPSSKATANTVNSGSGMNGQGGAEKGPHAIEGLTLSGSPNGSTSGTLTQAKKNIHLTNNTQLIVSVAPFS
jgi:hypothetical protein